VRVLSLLLIFIAVIVSMRTMLVENGFVLKDDMTFPLSDEQTREALTNRFSVWYGKIGGSYDPTLPSSIPFWLWYNAFDLVLNTDLVGKLFIIMLFTLAGYSMYTFSKRLISFPSSLLAAFLYMFNPWTFDRIASGHLNLLMGYALAPIPLMFAFKLRERIDFKDCIFASLSLALILCFTTHFFALILIVVVFYVVFMAIFSKEFCSKKRIASIVLVFTIALLLNFFWLLPTLVDYSIVRTSIIEPAVSGSIIKTINQKASILNTLRLTGYWLPYFRDSVSELGFLSPIWNVFSFAIPILAFVHMLYPKKDKRVIFLSVAAAVFLLPTTIASSYPEVYLQAINYFPPLALFRDSYKFVGITCLSYSVLIGCLFDALLVFISKAKGGNVRISEGRGIRRTAKVFLALFALGLILVSTVTYATPNLLSGNYAGQLSATNPPSYWFDVGNFLANESAWRVFWAPPFPQMQYEFCNSSSIDPVDEYLTSPYAVSLKSRNPYLRNCLEFLTSLLYEDHYDVHIGQLLAPLSVKYIVMRLDATPKMLEGQYPATKLQAVMENQQGLIKVLESGRWVVYKNTYASPFITTSTSNEMIVFSDFSEAKSLGYMFEKNLPSLLFINPENSSPNDAKIIAVSNDMANTTPVTLAIPFYQSFAADSLLEQFRGKTRVMYFAEGENMILEEENLVPNFSFEEGLAHWNLGNETFSVKVAEDATNGRNSVEVTTSNNATGSWSWITSDNIPIVPKTIYRFSSNIKMSNSMQSHVKVVGFNEAKGDWETICFVPLGIDGTLDWTAYEFLWESPGFSKIRMVLNAGWVKDPSAGNATTLFDNISVTPLIIYDSSFSNERALPLEGKSEIQFRISSASNYRTGLRAFATETSNISVKFSSNDMEQTAQMLLQPNSSDLVYSSPIYLTPNNYTLEVSSEKPVILDALVVISVNKESETLQDFSSVSNETPAEVVTFERTSSTSYTAEINASCPFLLSFAEPYDPSWIAFVNGQRIEPVPLYSVINGFWIDKTGLLNITIEYEPQRLFYYGSTISIATLILCLACLTHALIQSRKATQQKRAKVLSEESK